MNSTKGIKEGTNASDSVSSKAIVPKKKDKRDGSANLRKWAKGESGNPKGITRKQKDLKEVRGQLQKIFSESNKESKGTKLESFCRNLIDQGYKNPNYARLTLEYTYGKPAQEVQVRDLTLEDMFSQALSQFSQGNIPPSPPGTVGDAANANDIIDIEPTDE